MPARSYHEAEAAALAIRISSSRSMHSSEVLAAFRSSGEALPLREVVARSGLPKSMAFRLLYTLERCGMIEKVGENLYRSYVRPFRQKPYRLGYAAQGTDYQFSKEISDGPAARGRRAGHRAHLASTTATARRSRSATPTSWCARRSISSSSSRPTSTSRRSSRRSTARPNIPLIAIEIPHPGRDLLRREQLRGRADRRPLPRPLGEAALARRRRRDRADRAASAPAACRRCG